MQAFSIGVLLLFSQTLSAVAQEGTASLSGMVTVFTGAGLPAALAELHALRARDAVFRATADAAGEYHFSGLPAGDYELTLRRDGFTPLNLRSIHIGEREQKELPAVQLAVHLCGDRHAPLDYVQPLPRGDYTGSLIGNVTVDQRPVVAQNPPVASAKVTLLCSGNVCGEATTEANGGFMFWSLPSGNFRVRVTLEGFYPLEQGGFTAQEGLESIYRPLFLERCAAGNCEAARRPKRVPGLCE